MKTLNLRTMAPRFALPGLSMLAAAGLAIAITPTSKIADQGPKTDLETMIPRQFGEWKMDETIVPLLADPKQTALLNKIYNQTLSRTYINTAGQRIMLSIAYELLAGCETLYSEVRAFRTLLLSCWLRRIIYEFNLHSSN